MKGKKNLILSAAIAFVVIIILIIVLFPKGNKDEEGAEVISKRVKLNLIDETVKVEEDGLKPVEGAAPATQPAPFSAEDSAPVAEPAPAPAEVKKAVEPVPAAPVEARVEPAPTAKKAPAKPRTIKTASVNKLALAVKKPWAINIASFPDREGANRLAKSLKSAGYNAYITSFKKDGVYYSRVRVGFYASREAAQRAGNAIKKQHNVQSPWVVKPGKDEAALHIR